MQKGFIGTLNVFVKKPMKRTEPLLVTSFRVSNAWLRKYSYHQGWAQTLEHF